MTSPLSLAFIVLTGNEACNIEKCLRSIAPLGAPVFVIDSLSTDDTVAIAKELGAQVLERAWTNHADQFNWAVDHAPIVSDWVFRLDADEEMTPELIAALPGFIDCVGPDVVGAYVRRRMYFLGRWIRYGSTYPQWTLRLFRRGHGRCESVMMDEHIVTQRGRDVRLSADISDKNNKDLTFWIDKHNSYASLQVQDILRVRDAANTSSAAVANGPQLGAALQGEQSERRRWLRDNLYMRLPLFIRPTLYFLFRLILKGGFLDGWQGLVYHFLHGLWYRLLIDAKLREHDMRCRPVTSAPTKQCVQSGT